MIGVQIYYTVYDRSTRVLYVLQQEYAVGMIQIHITDSTDMLHITDMYSSMYSR